MADKIIVPVSYFNGEPQSNLFVINTFTKEIKTIFTNKPEINYRVKGKGFTQIYHSPKNERFYIADFNQIHIFNSSTFKLIKSFSLNNMNDLHSIKVENEYVVIANTGMDCVDIFDLEGQFIKSISLLNFEDAQKRFLGVGIKEEKDNYYDNDINKPFHQRIVRDTFHINNCSIIDNRLIATSFIKKSLIDLSLFKEICPPLNSHIHDCLLFDDKIWITSVDGKIYFREKDLTKYLPFKEYVDLFKIGNFFGWCRGLFISDDFFYIGITQINSEISQKRWNTNISIEKTKTGIIKLNFKLKQIVDFYDLSDNNISRIFGFVVL